MDIFKFLLPNKDASKNYNTLWLMKLNETEHKKSEFLFEYFLFVLSLFCNVIKSDIS